jgi:di/tricarboxylate transporter
MTYDIATVLVLIAAAIVFFSWEIIPADVVALSLLLALVCCGVLPADKAFAGFGSDAVMMIFGLLIMTAALWRTGCVDLAGRYILRFGGTDPNRLLLVILISVATFSAFLSNTAATAFFLPVTFGVAARARQSVSKFLLPLSFASILTSSCTLFSTSTNIVVSDLISRRSVGNVTMAPMGVFELAPVGLPIAVGGLLYLWFVGRKLLPERGESDPRVDLFGLKPYLSEVMIVPGSPLIGKTLGESGVGSDLDLTVQRIVRQKHISLPPLPNTALEEGDVLTVQGHTEEILKVKDEAGIDIKADAKLSVPTLEGDAVSLVEAILLSRSRLIGRTLKNFRFRERFGVQVLAIQRVGGASHAKISQTRLRLGDVLLLQGTPERIRAMEESDDVRLLRQVDNPRPNYKQARVAAGIFVLVLAAATVKLVALPVAAVLGAVLVFICRAISPEEAYRQVEWKTLIVIGSMLSLGVAMEHSGTDRYIANGIVQLLKDAGPIWVLSGFFVLTVILTQPMSNQAAAVVVLPVALETAIRLDLNPRTFAMVIALAASCSYMTPLEPSCLLVYGPGRYRFRDFFIVGAPLTLLIYFLTVLLAPLVWPLRPQ